MLKEEVGNPVPAFSQVKGYFVLPSDETGATNKIIFQSKAYCD
jgi:hypothetical protein